VNTSIINGSLRATDTRNQGRKGIVKLEATEKLLYSEL
jgi:hypothetical protein